MPNLDLLGMIRAHHWVVGKLIVLDYYDGPHEGLCKLANPACEFSFKMIAERYNPDGLDDRFIRLYSLPLGSVDQAASWMEQTTLQGLPVISAGSRSENLDHEDVSDCFIEQLLHTASRTCWVVQSTSFRDFDGRWIVHEELHNGQLIQLSTNSSEGIDRLLVSQVRPKRGE